MSKKHLAFLTRRPQTAQSGLEIKLNGTTEIIDRLLLAQRQAPWKAIGGGGDGGTDTGGTDTGGTDTGGTDTGGL